MVAGLALLVGLGLFLAWRSGRDGDGLPEENVLTAYRVVYEVEEEGAEPRREELAALRPDHSRLVSTRNGELLSGSITNDNGQWVWFAGGQPGWRRVGPVPGMGHDPRPLPVLRWGSKRGVVKVVGDDDVDGRPCTVVRTGGPLGDDLKEPTEDDHADLCVHETGVVLREEWTLDGTVVRRKVAAEFEPGADLAPRDFQPAPLAPPLPDAVSGVHDARELTAQERSLLVPVPVLDGFRLDVSYARVERAAFGDPVYVRRYVDGPRLLAVEQGTRAPSFEPDGVRVRSEGGRAIGYLRPSLDASSLLVLVGTDRLLRIRSADVDAMLALAEALFEAQ